ncbi:hypothetical protein MKZ38_005892 [Zalerion maritima]|uniref:Uncharacterized protein n=1 Tax=Zalerion maritima TaxID=339359 RepID=A0AAD5RKI6_9PEZI|nr:hypothetical protein MKZ38_005892 [Zalerion maritima]
MAAVALVRACDHAESNVLSLEAANREELWRGILNASVGTETVERRVTMDGIAQAETKTLEDVITRLENSEVDLWRHKNCRQIDRVLESQTTTSLSTVQPFLQEPSIRPQVGYSDPGCETLLRLTCAALELADDSVGRLFEGDQYRAESTVPATGEGTFNQYRLQQRLWQVDMITCASSFADITETLWGK